MVGQALPGTGYLLSWLLGRHANLRLGFDTILTADGAASLLVAWSNPCVALFASPAQLPADKSAAARARQGNYLPAAVVQPESAGELVLSADESSSGLAMQSPAEYELPRLTILHLCNGFVVVPLLAGCSMPQLKSLYLANRNGQSKIDLTHMGHSRIWRSLGG